MDTPSPVISAPFILPGGQFDRPYQSGLPGNGYKLSATGGYPFSPTQSKYPTGFYWQLIPGKLPTQKLPQGMTLNANGVISGTPVWPKPPIPSTPQTYTIQVRATDFLGKTATANFTLVIAPPPGPEIITECPLPQGLEKYPYPLVQLKALNGKPSYTWPKPAGLPPGLVWNEQGYISGTPTTRGTYPIVIKVVDANGLFATKNCSITIRPAPEIIVKGIFKCARVGDSYCEEIEAWGGDQPYTWTATGMPPGMTIQALENSKAKICGNFTQNGSFTINVTAKDQAGRPDSENFTFEVRPALQITTASPLPFGIKGSAYPGKTGSPTVTINATGGWPPYTRQRLIGILPPGLTLNTASGAITGTPTQIGNYKFTIRVYDSCKPPEKFVDKEFETTIYDPLEIVDTSILQCHTINKTISPPFCLTAKGGRPTYSWSINSGSLPAGLTLNNSTGCISGTITSGGNFSVTIQVKDQNEIETLKSFNFRVYDELIITSSCPLAFGTNGTSYSANLTAVGGNPPHVWTVPSPSVLPAGLSINPATGQISGTPRVTGNFSFDYRVTDSCGNTATKNCSMRIFEPLRIIDTNILSCYTINKTISPGFCLTATGGLPSYEWSIQSGNLPTGLSFSSNGCISGTISQSGNFAVTAKVKDQNGTEIQKIFSFVVYDELKITSSCPLAFGTNGTFYSANLSATGGNPPYSWSVPSPSTLPTGLAINSTNGQISGTPKITGDYVFAYKVVDACGNNATTNCSISLYEPLKITTNNLFSCVWVGDDSECFQVQAAGGAPTYTWDAVNLPPSLTVNATSGKICGNFTQAGNFTSTIRVMDQNGSFIEKSFSTQVNAPLEITTACPLPDGTMEQLYNRTLTATGGKPPYTWQILPQIYVADFYNNKIRKFYEGGIVTTYAGNGINASLDGGLTSSSFNNPYGMGFDPNGNLYVADRTKIRKISFSGNVTTLNGIFSGPEDMVADELGNVYVADAGKHVITKINSNSSLPNIDIAGQSGWAGFADGSNSSARFSGVQGICWDLTGNMILTDMSNHAVRKVTTQGNVTTVAGKPSAQGYQDGNVQNAMFNGPHDVKVDQYGTIYVLDHTNGCIRKISTNGTVSTLGTQYNLNKPYCLSVDKNGFVYVSDGDMNHNISKISPNGNVTVIAGGGNGSVDNVSPLLAKFSSPRGVEINPYEDLPLGLSLNSTTGVISGTPKDYGLFKITYQVTDSCDNKVISTCNLQINPPPCDLAISITSTNPSTPNGTDGTATVTCIGGIGPFVYTLSSNGSAVSTSSLTSSRSYAFSGLSFGVNYTASVDSVGGSSCNSQQDFSLPHSAIQFDADYVILTYEFSDGQDLDTHSELLGMSNLSGGAPLPIGWNRSGSPSQPSVNPFFFWGGDNTGTGEESVYIDLIKFKQFHPGINEIAIDCRGRWHVTRGIQPVKIVATLFKGGSVVKSNYTFTNTSATSTRILNSFDNTVTTLSQNPNNNERIAVFTFNLSTKTGRFVTAWP